MTYVRGSAKVTGVLFRFLWETLTRFAKTVGCLCFVAGIIVAASRYRDSLTAREALRYRESSLLSERLRRVDELYGKTQRTIMEFKGAAEFPAQYAAASFTPKFPTRIDSVEAFQKARTQLSQVSAAKEALKAFTFERFNSSTEEIRRKLLDYSSSISPSPPHPEPPAPPDLAPPASSNTGIFEEEMRSSSIKERQGALQKAREFLETLRASAENPENQQKLEGAIAELSVLSKLLPEEAARAEPRSSAPAPPSPTEPTNAQKVAERLTQVQASVRAAVLSSWALDEAFDRALQTLDNEQQAFSRAGMLVNREKEQARLFMAIAIAAGTLSGMFFLLIGDWTQKASTEVLDYWCELVADCQASPKEVYDVVESAVRARQVPGLECTRELWHEGGAVSAKREYLRFARERLCFEICAAPFGTGFFVSYRAAMFPLIVDPLGILLLLFLVAATFGLLVGSFGLVWGGLILVLGLCALALVMRTAVARGLGELDRVFMKTPLLGPLYELFLRPLTYYRIDSQAMYVKAVQGAVAQSIESIFGDQGVRMTPGMVTPPVLEELSHR